MIRAPLLMNTIAVCWAKRALLACALLLAAARVASADDIAFGFTYSGDRVGTIDLNTGVFTPLAAQPTAYAGIGMTGGNVYAAQYASLFNNVPSPFYQIDQTTGTATLLGTSNLGISDMGSTSGGGLFGWGHNGGLFSLNPSNGAATLVGPSLRSPFGGTSVTTMSSWGPNLYVTLNSLLYLVDATTGNLTLIGDTGQGLSAVSFIGNTLYGINVIGDVYSLNPTNGAATYVSSTGAGEFAGFVPFSGGGTATPEPSSLLLLGTGLISAAAWRRKRNR